MRQMVITRYGPPDVLRLREVADPVPGPGEVRIAVAAAGVNFADLLARVGLYPDAPKPPVVVGYEVCGTVDAVGPGVTGPRPGDRVVALTRFGGYADSVVTPATFVFPVPAALTDVEAAAVPVNYLTAWLAVCRFANVAAGETVLIIGVGGGVGVAAAQLARRRDAIVIGTASSRKHDALRQFDLGIAHLFDPAVVDMTREVRRFTADRGVDVVLDSLGGRSFRRSYRLLAPLGRLVMYGVSAVAPGDRRRWFAAIRAIVQMPRFRPLSLMNANRGVLGLNLGHLWGEHRRLASAMDDLNAGFRAGALKPVVARTFPLERAADAHRLLHSRGNVGKVVLTCRA